MKLAGILLAAGASIRFGEEDKLLANFKSAPLVTHAAGTLKSLNPDILIAVTRSNGVAELLSEFANVSPDQDSFDLSASLRAGITEAARVEATHALVVLGDMPLVSVALLRDVLARSSEAQASASTDGLRRMPPACFPCSDFQALLSFDGDKGARTLLHSIPVENLASTDTRALRDIDTLSDLNALSEL